MGGFAAVRARRSRSRVDERAPSDAELLPLIEAASTAADHSGLHPWRIIALRGEARDRLGAALVEASGREGEDAERLAKKPLRASLLLALVLSPVEHPKVPEWEQAASAAGVAHYLSLLLDDAGWGVMWRTGPWVRSDAVARAHELAPGEALLGWLYVGGRADEVPPRRAGVDPSTKLSSV